MSVSMQLKLELCVTNGADMLRLFPCALCLTQSQWEVRFSNSRRLPYFYHSVTQQSTWQIPQGHTEESIRSLPGAKYLDPANAPGGASDKPDKVRASHLLIKHAGSRRPSSWKEVSLIVVT